MRIAFFLVSAIFLAPGPAGDAKKAQASLQGDWIAIALEEKGEKASPDEVKKENFSMIIKGNDLLLRHGTGEPTRFTFTLDPSKTPAHIDLKHAGDPTDSGVIHAIYALDKGELKLCLGSNAGDKPEQRPREFATGGSSERPAKGKVMFTFKQGKK